MSHPYSLSSPTQIYRFVKGVGYDTLFSISSAAARRSYRNPVADRLREIRNQSSPLPPVDPDKDAVLYFVNRVWPETKVFEGLTGRALRMRGHRVDVVCGNVLPQLVAAPGNLEGIGPASLPWRYDLAEKSEALSAANYNRAVIGQFGLPVADLSDWLEAEERRNIEKNVRRYSGEWDEFTYHGHAIGEWCKTSVAWQLTGETIDGSLSHVQWLYQRAAYAACVTAVAFEHILATRAPDVLVLLNGIFAPERAAYEIARRRGVRVVTHDVGQHQDSFVLAHNKPANYFQYDAEWPTRRERPLSEKERKEIRTYLQQRAGTDPDRMRVNYWPSMTKERDEILKKLNLDPDRLTFVLFPNILWDSAVLKRDVAFDGLLDWIFSTIEVMEELPNAQLIIRCHPAEVRHNRSTEERVENQIHNVFSSVPSNVRVVPSESDISSYRLMDMSDAVLVYTSTTGMEAALRGKPVLVAGETHYRGKGFTIDIETKDEYQRLLRSDLSGLRPTDDEIARAERYAYLFFIEGHISLPFFTRSSSGPSIDFQFDSFDELEPGNSKALDRVCDSIVDGRSFIYPDTCSRRRVLEDVKTGVFA